MSQKKQKNAIVDGMTCSNCALGVKKIIEKNGGQNVMVSFSTGEATYLASSKDIEQSIIKGINEGGYQFLEHANNEQFSKVEKLFAFCLVFTLPLFAHMFVPKDSFLNNPLVQVTLTLPVLFSGGLFFIKSAISSLKIGVPNMDVLISIGILSSFFYSTYGVFIFWGTPEVHNYLFFETTATITTLVLLGNVMEHRSVQQTTSALKDLKNLQPVKANKIVDGQVKNVTLESINLGDYLQINQGDHFPLDGIVTEGEFEVDESMISGESKPVFKPIGSKVIGSSLVISGNGIIMCSSTKGQSTLDQIISLVKQAQDSKPQIQKLGDKISAIFVPVVVGISLVTFLIAFFVFNISLQQSLMQSIAVLVISCPCAMGLAAPTAIMVGVGKAAKKGILIKGGQTLEKIAKSTTIVFDKTGTLTTGKFTINKMTTVDYSKEKINGSLIALCAKSSHPISRSIHSSLRSSHKTAELLNITEKKGHGMTGNDLQGNTWELCSTTAVNKLQNKELDSDLCVLFNQQIIAQLWISDQVKPQVKESIQWLKSQGITPILLSGDKKEKCEFTASQVGINQIYAEKTPAEKLSIIKELNQTTKTMMVGDGINDAPALAQSHVGISFSAATDSAIHSSDVVLMNKNFWSITTTVALSQQTYRTIKQNFFWAFAYNAIAIPIASMGYLKPMVAALSMAFSDVIVIGNSILLKFKRRP